MTPLTEEELKAVLPANLKKTVNQQLITEINTTLTQPEEFERYRENLLGYTQVLKEGKFKLQNYLDAVKYVSFKMMNMTNTQAYERTFPDKIARFDAEEVSAKDRSSYIYAYNKSKLVTLLLAQSVIPTWILNQDNYQMAINVQVELMLGANSEKVRSDAANSVMTHLKQPETKKIELDVGTKEDSTIAILRQQTLALAAQQRDMILAGQLNAQQVAHSRLVIDVDSEEVDS